MDTATPCPTNEGISADDGPLILPSEVMHFLRIPNQAALRYLIRTGRVIAPDVVLSKKLQRWTRSRFAAWLDERRNHTNGK